MYTQNNSDLQNIDKNKSVKKTESPSKNVTFESDNVGNNDTDYIQSRLFQGTCFVCI
jgi:hypothetical protein